MKTQKTIALLATALVVLGLHSAQAVLIEWSGTTTGNWTDGTKWVGGTAPVNGDSADIDSGSGTYDVNLNTAFTVESGQSLTADRSGLHPEFILSNGSSSILTLATGGTIDIAFFRVRFNDADASDFIIQPGATLNTDDFASGPDDSFNIKFIADASGVTTWNAAGFSASGSTGNTQALEVDLTNYALTSGFTLDLVSYASQSDSFDTVTVTGIGGGIWTEGVDYTFSYGTGLNDTISLTIIPEPSTLVLFGAVFGAMLAARRRRGVRSAR